MKLKITDVADQISQQKDKDYAKKRQDLDTSSIIRAQDEVQRAVVETTQAVLDFMAAHEPKVHVQNHPEFPQSIATPDVKEAVTALRDLIKTVETKETDLSGIQVKLIDIVAQLKSLPREFKFPDIPQAPDKVTVLNQPDYTPALKALEAAIKAIDVMPQVNVAPAKVNVDTKELAKAMREMEAAVVTAVSSIPVTEVNVDFTTLEKAIGRVEKAVNSIDIPIPTHTGGGSATIGLFTKPYDSVYRTINSDNDVYETKLDGVTQETVTVTFTDATKAELLSAARTI